MSKKANGIFITLIVIVVALIAFAQIYVIKEAEKERSEYYFTTDATQKEYEEVDGYTLFESENNNLSFLYPEEWVVDTDDVGEVYLYDPNGYGEIYCTVATEDMVALSSDDYNSDYFNPKLDTYMTFNGTDYFGDNIEMCLDINGYDTFMWYNNMYPADDESGQTYDLEYTSLLGDGNTIFTGMYSNSEDVLRVIAGSLKY